MNKEKKKNLTSRFTANRERIRVFWWRVLKGYLPARAELLRRHIGDDARCGMCGSGEETLFHSLVTCNQAKLFWVEAFRFFAVKLPRLHPLTWAKDRSNNRKSILLYLTGT